MRPSVSRGCGAAAGTFVEIGAACRAEPLAVLTALDVTRYRQEPVFAHRRAKIEHSLSGIVQKNVGIIGLVGTDFSEKQVNVLVDIDRDVFETEPAG